MKTKWLVIGGLVLSACTGTGELGEPVRADADLGRDEGPNATSDAMTLVDAPPDSEVQVGADADADVLPVPCSTRITYGSTWIRGERATLHDDVAGRITWDGTCRTDASGNGFAELSNGWTPFFQGRSCIISLDYSGDCTNIPTTCETRVGYGPSWLAPPNHPNSFDDVLDVVTWDGTCRASGGNSFARLSNGWEPHFQGSNACDISLRHTECGGLFSNPVIANDCPDPGVMKDGDTYFLTCTHTGGAGIFPIYTSTDMVTWRRSGAILAQRPDWANDRFWAPEIHKVAENRYVAYYTASTRADNRLSIGAAVATAADGPYQDIGAPLIYDPTPGVIDAHYFQASDGRRFLTWKRDGNAVGQNTPILIQEVAADGLTRQGSVTTILTNDRAWEGAVVEGQWIVEHDGYFYLFYSGNGYASPSYGVGIARATSPTGPYTKAAEQILRTNGEWDGPGHGAVLRGPGGDWVHVYHSWQKGRVGQSPGRQVLLDRVDWTNGWPRMLGAPSKRSQPVP